MIEIVETFLADYGVTNRLSPGRFDGLRKVLAELQAHAGKPLLECDELDVSDFLNSLVAAGLHVNTVRKYNHAIKPFYRWAWRRRLFDVETMMRIREIKNPRGASANQKPRPYKRTEIQEFWTGLDARWPRSTDKQLRRWVRGTSKYKNVWRTGMYRQTAALVSLALYHGLRHNEIELLSMDDIHPDNAYIVVHGKTVVHEDPKIREVPYTEAGRALIASWFEFREWLKPDHDRPWLVVNAAATLNRAIGASQPNWPISSQGLDRVPGYVGRYEFHRFRHTCATEWLRAGMELETVSKLLGHASIAQTLVYAEIAKEDLMRSARRHERAFIAAIGPSERAA